MTKAAVYKCKNIWHFKVLLLLLPDKYDKR